MIWRISQTELVALCGIFFAPARANNNQKGTMLELKLSEEQQMLREMVRDFTTNEIKPIAAKIDQEAKIPEELIKKMAELGFLGISFPEEYGGGGMGEVGYCLMQEEIARGCMSTATFIGAHQSTQSSTRSGTRRGSARAFR